MPSLLGRKLLTAPLVAAPAAPATPPAPAPGTPPATPAAAAAPADKSLPDPTGQARTVGLVLCAVAIVAAIVIQLADWGGDPFKPADVKEANFQLFAGFYIAALLIERAAELIAPSMPPWAAEGADEAAKVAQTKADRATVMLGVTFVLGVVGAGVLGLYFLEAAGMHAPSHTVDSILTGLVIAGGTAKLHSFMALIQKSTNPTSGTKTA